MAIYKPFRKESNTNYGARQLRVRQLRPDAYVNRQYQYARRPAPSGALLRVGSA